VLDQGTTAAMRNAMGLTLVARTVIESSIQLGPGQELVRPEWTHGCVVAGNAVPAGGLLLDAIIIEPVTGGAFPSAQAAGITWAVDNGAKVINLSFGGTPGEAASQVVTDAAAYARDAGVHIIFSAGNDDVADLAPGAGLCRTFVNVHASIAFDPATDRRALFSNHHADASGCSAGVNVMSLGPYGELSRWNGTSASAPHMAHLMARALTGGQFTANQVGAAFRANTRDTGAGTSEQGLGAWDLHRALASLGGVPTFGSYQGPDITHVDTRGAASNGGTTGFSVTPASSVQPDDLQLVFIVSSHGANFVVPHGWTMLTDEHYPASWEQSAGQTVGPTKLRVLARPYAAGDPASISASFGGNTWFSAFGIMTLRGVGGLDPEKCVPVVRFGTSASVQTPAVLPSSVNDLLVCVFMQRHPTATTGTLSVPSGLTSRGFFRPSAGTTGYTMLLTTAQRTDSGHIPSFTSTSNDATGTWCAVAVTVAPPPPPAAVVVQSEPAGPLNAFLPFFMGA
jgi:hypothetical protein